MAAARTARRVLEWTHLDAKVDGSRGAMKDGRASDDEGRSEGRQWQKADRQYRGQCHFTRVQFPRGRAKQEI